MRLFLTLVFFATALVAFGQNGKVRGTVFDGETGESIIGGNVVLKDNTTTGTATDLDGQFTLSLPAGEYSIIVSSIGYKPLEINEVKVVAGEVVTLNNLQLMPAGAVLDEVVVTAEATATTESALTAMKQKAPVMLDGISAAKMKLTGDATAVEAAKRVTGVSIEGGKYVYVRGLGDRYTKTTMNGMDIPGLDPDKNSLQMDIFPTNLVKSIVVSKNFTADVPADFTGGLLNVDTKDFPEEKLFNVSFSMSFNPSMHLNSEYLTYNGGGTDFLGFDDGTRALPNGASQSNIPTPISGHSTADVTNFINSFDSELGTTRQSSPLDYSLGISYGNQIELKERNGETPKLGYILSLSYKSSYKYYDEAFFGEYQRLQRDPSQYELVYANTQSGQIGEHNVLVGAMAGIAYKTSSSKIRLTAMHLQNGESRAARFSIDNSPSAVGQSGYFAFSDNLEYNQRSLTNVLLNGKHRFKDNKWELNWKISPTLSISDDPDIRKTAFTQSTGNNNYTFSAGAGGLPSRIWRDLTEVNIPVRVDLTSEHQIGGRDAKLKFGASYVYKSRNYEILSYGLRFFGSQQPWAEPDASLVLQPENIYSSDQNNIYYQSGNSTPNPNEYSSNLSNTALYVSEEFSLSSKLKTILGVRMENFVQNHTGRDQAWASGDRTNGRNLDNEEVLSSLDFFPSVNLIYSIGDDDQKVQQNLRAAYSRTVARPSFKELSFAQILDPVSNRFFNGSFFEYDDWSGKLVQTDIDNIDLRWELFMGSGQLFSVSAFYKRFQNPIEMVRIAVQPTVAEFQPRNVGEGTVLGLEFEVNKNLAFVGLEKLSLNGNLTVVQSSIDMTESEFNARKLFERTGENIENTRAMAGQAPYVVNLGAIYGDMQKGLDIGLFYNVKGPTLHVVGIGLYPDVYYQPFHSLNFSINKKLGASYATSIDFKVSNILNDKIEYAFESYQAENQLFQSLNPGMSFGIGISHEF